jgi:hypothetical protein
VLEEMSGPVHDGLKTDPYFGDGRTRQQDLKQRRNVWPSRQVLLIPLKQTNPF